MTLHHLVDLAKHAVVSEDHHCCVDNGSRASALQLTVDGKMKVIVCIFFRCA